MEIQSYDYATGEIHRDTVSAHHADLKRVKSRLTRAINSFFSLRGVGGEFYAEELREYITSHGIVCAPNSPCRIMQILKKEGKLNYTLLSRSNSLYRVEKINEQHTN